MNGLQMHWVDVHRRWHLRALAIGAAALSACAIGVLNGATRVLDSYLLAWLFAASLSLGSIGALMMYHLTGGAWGVPVRRYFEAAAAQMPVLAALWLPLGFGVAHVFPWAASSAATDPVVLAKHWYLNVPFFSGRAVLYLVAWIVLAIVLERSAR